MEQWRPRTRKAIVAPVKPFKKENRTTFGIAYFTDEAQAKQYHVFIRTRGDKYRGGFLSGMRCGRDATFDYIDKKGRKLFAVTTK